MGASKSVGFGSYPAYISVSSLTSRLRSVRAAAYAVCSFVCPVNYPPAGIMSVECRHPHRGSWTLAPVQPANVNTRPFLRCNPPTNALMYPLR